MAVPDRGYAQTGSNDPLVSWNQVSATNGVNKPPLVT